jgi:hypothetical protein
LRRSQRHWLNWSRFNHLTRKYVRHAAFGIPIRRSVSLRHVLRQEPYAVTLHVRIYAGGGRQWPSLPRPNSDRGLVGEIGER